MEQIVLNANLRYVIAGLSLEQRGLLLNALLWGEEDALEEAVGNIYKYIMLLQQELADKKQKMRALGAKGGRARQKAAEGLTADLFSDDEAAVDDVEAAVEKGGTKRKEAKEKILNKKIKNLFITRAVPKETEEKIFKPPLLEEVRAFVQKEGLAVDPETFVDFYDSHGWKVGQTAIKNWKATVRLWHRRAGNEKPTPAQKADKARAAPAAFEEETYWHELLERSKPDTVGLCWAKETAHCVDEADGEKAATQDLGNEMNKEDEPIENVEDSFDSPFVKFMRRIEEQ